MELITKNFWIAFIAVTVVNAFILKYRSKQHIEKNPELEKGYNSLIKAYLLFGNIPWVIMAAGIISGTTNNVFDYLNLRAMNPAVLAFHASILCLWILGAYWVYLKDGAVFLEKHPGLVRKSNFSSNDQLSALQIRLLYPLIIIGNIIVLTIMWFTDMPASPF